VIVIRPHCERSEAIKGRRQRALDCFVARAPRNDEAVADPIDLALIGRRPFVARQNGRILLLAAKTRKVTKCDWNLAARMPPGETRTRRELIDKQ
jgi:hypothetical protein